MQTVPEKYQHLSADAQILFDRLNCEFAAILFDITGATELIEREFAPRSSDDQRTTDAGMTHSHSS